MSKIRVVRAIGFLNDLFCGWSFIAAPAELSIPFLLDEKPTVVPVSSVGERSGRAWCSASGSPALKYKSHRPKVFLPHDHHMAYAILLPSVLSGRVCLTNIA